MLFCQMKLQPFISILSYPHTAQESIQSPTCTHILPQQLCVVGLVKGDWLVQGHSVNFMAASGLEPKYLWP